jgi:stringent starvation protein B
LISFQARFNGQVQHISVPVENVAAIYAKENGEGMGFQLDSKGRDEDVPEEGEQGESMDTPEAPEPAPTRPKLTRIK